MTPTRALHRGPSDRRRRRRTGAAATTAAAMVMTKNAMPLNISCEASLKKDLW
jgi:hypothetical protein